MTKDIPASVRQRLMNLARAQGTDFQYLLTRYGLERLLYRLSQSKHADRFILKGAMLFQTWSDAPHRPTRDLDLLAAGAPSVPEFVAIFRDIVSRAVDDDGLTFNAENVQGEAIKEEDEYQGIRIRGEARLGAARIPLQIDIGFGDAVTPAPVEIDYPTLLEFPAPVLRAYNRETVVAEKFQAMVVLGMANSRMKDFFDLWSLARQFSFEGPLLAEALRATFARRQTEFPDGPPLALSAEFADDATKQTQWRAFLRNSELTAVELVEVVQSLREFLAPPAEALRMGIPFAMNWHPQREWQE